MSTAERLPKGMQGLWPLLCVCWAMGVLPYSIKPPMQVVRTKVGLLISCTPVLAEIAFLITSFYDYHQSHLVPGRETFVSRVLTISMAMVCTLLLPIVLVCFVTRTGVTRCQRLLLFLATAERILEGAMFNKPPILLRRPCVIFTMILVLTGTCVEMYFQCTLWKDTEIQMIFEVWVMLILLIVVHLFCSLAIMMNYYFEVANSQLLLLISDIRSQAKGSKEGSTNVILREVLRGYLRPGTIDAARRAATMQRTRNVTERLGAIRDAHFALKQACEVIDEMFTAVLLVFYVHVLIAMMASLYFTVLSSQMRLSTFEAALLGVSAFGFAALGAAVAWAAGGVESTAGDQACTAGVAVLVAARGQPAVENEVRLFLQQLRARPALFYAGGLFLLDLRFFVGLLGAIVGYLSVVAQFAMPDDPEPCSLCSAVNVTEFCKTYLHVP